MRRRAGATIALVLLLGGCGASALVPPVPPTEHEARRYLDTVVAIVLGGRLAQLCDLGSGTCEQTLRSTEPETVPRVAPTVLRTWIVAPTQTPDGTLAVGGRILEVCGLDGRGRPYVSEILVFGDGGRLIGKEAVFWTGLRIARDPVVGEPRPPSPPCPDQG